MGIILRGNCFVRFSAKEFIESERSCLQNYNEHCIVIGLRCITDDPEELIWRTGVTGGSFQEIRVFSGRGRTGSTGEINTNFRCVIEE